MTLKGGMRRICFFFWRSSERAPIDLYRERPIWASLQGNSCRDGRVSRWSGMPSPPYLKRRDHNAPKCLGPSTCMPIHDMRNSNWILRGDQTRRDENFWYGLTTKAKASASSSASNKLAAVTLGSRRWTWSDARICLR